MDPPQAKDVEQDGQQHRQDAECEEVVVVDKGGAQPAGVVLSQRLLLKVPAGNTSVSHTCLTETLKLPPASVNWSPNSHNFMLIHTDASKCQM